MKFYPANGQLRKNRDEFLNYSDLWNDFFNDNIIRPSFNVPKANIREEAEFFEIEMAVPGIEKNEIRIDVDKDILKISKSSENEEVNNAYNSVEFNYTEFSRSFRLPESINTEKIEAEMNKGILSVKLPKKKEAIDKGPREIKIS